MSRTYRVIMAANEAGVQALALDANLTILFPIRRFEGLDSLDDGAFGDNIGRVFTQDAGWVALAYKEI